MKTTIKSFLVAAVAATTLFSCAKEIESPEGAVPGNPGDVQISIGLGGGATTYATSTIEKTIHEGNAVLYNTGTKAQIPITNVSFAGGKFTATVPAAGFESGKTKAQLYIYVNGTLSPAGTPATPELMKAATIAQPLDLALANGIPAAIETPEVTLTGGTTFSEPYKLKRVASRVGARTTGTYSDYKVTLNKVNLSSGKLFPNNLTDAPALANGTIAQRELNGTLTDMFGTSEAVGYVYPSTDAEIVVTPKEGKGEPKTVKFSPKANMNYTIIITPMVNADGTFNNDISIEEWETNEDIPVDMNPTKDLAEVLIDPTITKFAAYKNGVSVDAGYVGNAISVEQLVKLPAGAAGVKQLTIATTFAAENPTQENPLSIKIQDINGNAFDIATFATPNAEVMKTFKITFSNDKVQYLNIYLKKYESSVEKLLVNIGGNLWMPFNTSGSTAGDEAIAAAILATDGATNAEKIVNYGYASVAQQNKLHGKFFGKNLTDAKIEAACPTGYRIAKMADWEALAGDATMPTGNIRWCDAPREQHNTVQQFKNSTLARIPKTDITSGAVNETKYRHFYYAFTAKAQLGATAGDILTFIGNGWAYAEVMAPTEILGGAIIWTGDKVGAKYKRLAVWNNGINYNEGPAADVASIRCVKK